MLHDHPSDQRLPHFPAARVLPALYADPNDRRLLGLASEQVDRERLMYILTLGVAEVSVEWGFGRGSTFRGRQLCCRACNCIDDQPQPALTLTPTSPPHARTRFLPQPYQRHGIARRLLDLALRYAAQSACRAVYLHVASFNEPALRLYRSAGFAELAVLPGFYTIT